MQPHSNPIDQFTARVSVEVVSSKHYKPHPLCAAFPPMSDEEFQELKDSIENIGVQTPIVIFEDMVIDGWHRYTAANEVGVDCPESELPEDVDPREFVLASNKTRRHLSKSQLALSFAKVYEWVSHGHYVRRGEPGSPLEKTNEELAELAGTSTKTIKQAKAVLKDGSEDVVKAVADGKISAKRGAEISKLPKDEQAAAINERPEPRPSILDGNAPDDEELQAMELAMEADRKLVNEMLEADEPMKLLHAEVTRLNYLVAHQEVRINSLMSEKNTAVKMIKDLQRQIDRAKRR